MQKAKNLNKKNKSSDDEDQNFDQWLQKRGNKTQSIIEPPIPKKKTASDLQGKKTVKYRQDPVMNSIYQQILRQSDKIEEDQIINAVQQPSKEVFWYNPHIVCGKIREIKKCNEEIKISFGLQEQGQCIMLKITESITVVLIGKIGYLPFESMNANLYLPRQIYQFMNLRRQAQVKSKTPQRLKLLEDGNYVVFIKRELLSNKSENIMDYPYLILDPSNLLYPTYLCSWIDCKRRTALSNYIQGDKTVNEALVYGSTCHRLLQWLSNQTTTPRQYWEKRQQIVKKLYDSMLYDMYLIDRTLQQFQQTCLIRLDNLVSFFKKHLVDKVQLEVQKFKKIYLKIDKIVSSEFMFRSNFFGLKGKIDLLLAGQLIDKRNNTRQQVYVPMELKTGKRVSQSHKRQTEIYNILIRETYKKKVVGLLYYSDSDIKFFRYEDPLSAYQIILIHRNQIAQNLVKLYSAGKIILPNFAEGFNQCDFCQLSALCENMYKKLEIQQDSTFQQVPSKYHPKIKDQVQAYSKQQIQYFAKWVRMTHLQEIEFKKVNVDNWKIGISHFILKHQQLNNLLKTDLKPRIEIIHNCKTLEQGQIFDDLYKVSQKMRIIIGSINLVQTCKVVYTFFKVQTKTFSMVMQMNNLQINFSKNQLVYFAHQKIDIDVDIQTFQNNFFPAMRGTIVNLINSTNNLKELLIQGSKMKEVVEIDSDDSFQLPLYFGIKPEQIVGLNDDQKLAYSKSIHQQQFCLIQGMPGTGKTELIIKLIEKFSKLGKRILITTFTNRSLDNILERLIESDKIQKSKIIREGSQYSCSKAMEILLSKKPIFSTLEDYKLYYNSKEIWFVTLSSLNNIHHLPKQFDIVILDQASQCLEPLCVDGLLRAKKFILIGDYKQLQPVVKSKQAFRYGMCISLFERLCKQFPQNSVSLKKQYRMNQKIMNLSNQLVYSGQLQLATTSIKNRTINLGQQWKKTIPVSFMAVFQPEQQIVFINYDPIIDSITKKYANEQKKIRRVIETELPTYIYRKMIQLKVPRSSISIIAALNSSVNKIVSMLKKQKTILDDHSTVLTIDKSQGIDKQVIILLIERGNEDLVENPRRLNVALTRAKSKLIVIGSEVHLSMMKVWEGTLGRMLKQYQIQLSKVMVEDMIRELKD